MCVTDPHDYPESMAAGVIPDRVRPVWTQETVSLRAVYRKKAGESARLVCEALGSPEPEVAWLRGDGTRVQAGVGRTVLHADTSGRYTCVASNGVGDAVTKNVSVNIASPEVIRDDAGVALPQVPALKMTGPGNTTVQQVRATFRSDFFSINFAALAFSKFFFPEPQIFLMIHTTLLASILPKCARKTWNIYDCLQYYQRVVKFNLKPHKYKALRIKFNIP